MSFHDLHNGDLPLLLPNAWDVSSALAFLDAGFPAIGTTSFGVSAGAGHPDGRSSTQDASTLLARLLSPLPCYITIDVEDGYSDDPEQVADYVAQLGVAGINIEDSKSAALVDPVDHAAKVAAIKRRCPDLYVNARVDTYWFKLDATVSATADRANRYVEAGADGVFVPGASDPAVLRDLTSKIPVPVNILPIPELTLQEYRDLGVRRISTGSLPYRAAIDAAVGVAENIRDGKGAPPATSYPAMQERLERYVDRRF